MRGSVGNADANGSLKLSGRGYGFRLGIDTAFANGTDGLVQLDDDNGRIFAVQGNSAALHWHAYAWKSGAIVTGLIPGSRVAYVIAESPDEVK